MADDEKVAKQKRKKADDVALVFGATEDGETLGVLRKRGERVEPALVRRAMEGQPIHGELVRLSPREEPLLYDVDVVYDARADQAATETPAGPAQIATRSYRKGWDRVFKKKPRTLN